MKRRKFLPVNQLSKIVKLDSEYKELEKIYSQLDSFDYSQNLRRNKKNCDLIGDIDQLHSKISERLSDIFEETQKILKK